MKVRLISIAQRVPVWVQEGFDAYRRRLPRECALELLEPPPVKRAKGVDSARAKEIEGEVLLRAVPKASRIIALDERGQGWNSRELSQRLDGWMQEGRDAAWLIGGADGLSDACKAQAEQVWSLSPLTFPHALVRVLAAEQLYRAWSLLRGMPYHRD